MLLTIESRVKVRDRERLFPRYFAILSCFVFHFPFRMEFQDLAAQDIPEKFHREDLEEKVTNGVSAESKRMCEANEYFQSPEEEKMKPYAEYISKILRSEQLQPTTLGTLDPQPGGSSTSSHRWIVDSGATHHVSGSEPLFKPLDPFNCEITLANGSSAPITGKEAMGKSLGLPAHPDPDAFTTRHPVEDVKGVDVKPHPGAFNFFGIDRDTVPEKAMGKSLGLPADTDRDAFTTPLQDLHVAGLQVLEDGKWELGLQVLKDGKWVDVKPHPGAIVIKIGDQLQEAGEKTPHVAIKPFQTPVEEKIELYSYGPSEITVFSSPQLAGPFIFNFSGISGWTIPSSSSNSSSFWILDSGATHHVCCSPASFESFDPLFNCVGTLPNGHTVPVGGIGAVRLCNDLTLQNVLFVPQFHWNLLSISALTHQHPYVVSFYSDHYVIEDPIQGRRIVMGKQSGNFYTLDVSKMFLVSYGPSEIKVPFSPQLAGPSMFHFSGLSRWAIPSSFSNSSSYWILDSGVTHHVCCSLASFESFNPRFNSVGTLPTGHTVPVDGIGSVCLCNDLTLQNVLFVPQFHCNLLSISALTQQHQYVVSFDSDHYVIEDPIQGRRIVMGKRSGNFYTLHLSQMFLFSP